MRMKCTQCGSENVTIVYSQFYPKYYNRPEAKQTILRCWDCELGEPLLDKWWVDKRTFNKHLSNKFFRSDKDE